MTGLLRRFVNGADIGSQITFDTYGLDETADKLKELIETSAVMAQKYEVVATNTICRNKQFECKS